MNQLLKKKLFGFFYEVICGMGHFDVRVRQKPMII